MKNISDKVIPAILGVLWIIFGICVSVGLAAWSIKWMCRMIGVM